MKFWSKDYVSWKVAKWGGRFFFLFGGVLNHVGKTSGNIWCRKGFPVARAMIYAGGVHLDARKPLRAWWIRWHFVWERFFPCLRVRQPSRAWRHLVDIRCHRRHDTSGLCDMTFECLFSFSPKGFIPCFPSVRKDISLEFPPGTSSFSPCLQMSHEPFLFFFFYYVVTVWVIM